MDWHLLWKATIVVIIGTFLLRLSGRKTISEMTLAETVLMISIGTLLIEPVTSNGLWQTFFVGLALVITLLILEYAQLKSNRLEKLITGKSKIIIENGEIKEKELRKLHLTVDQLEMHLRQYNVTSIQDVELATLEPSGHLGFTLKEHAQPATKGDLEKLQKQIEQLTNTQMNRNQTEEPHLFTEIKKKKGAKDAPSHLK